MARARTVPKSRRGAGADLHIIAVAKIKATLTEVAEALPNGDLKDKLVCVRLLLDQLDNKYLVADLEGKRFNGGGDPCCNCCSEDKSARFQ